MTASQGGLPVADDDGDVTSVGGLASEAGENEGSLVDVDGVGLDTRPLQGIQQIAQSIPVSTYVQASAVAGIASGITANPIILGVALFTEAIGIKQYLSAQHIQNDPFDPSYTIVFKPVLSGYPLLPASPSTTPQFNADAQNLVDAMGAVSAYLQALDVSENRLYSANQAMDLNSFIAQNAAINQYTAALVTAEKTQATAAQVFSQNIVATRSDVTVTPSQVSAYQNNLKLQGFSALPAQEQAVIKADFPSITDQQAIIAALTSASVSTSPQNLSGMLQQIASSSNTLSSNLAATTTPLTDTTVPLLPPQTITGTGPHAIAKFSRPETVYKIEYTGKDTATATDTVGNVVTSINNEVLQFSDQPYFIESGDGANIARLYSAGLGRLPDAGGLFGWEDIYSKNISAAVKTQGVYESLAETSGGFNSTLSIADGIIDSPEFSSKYGALSNANFVTQLYQNVLGRAPDATGLNTWLTWMSTGDATGTVYNRGMVLVGFAESPENITKASSWMTDMSKSG